jgi:hypothetical protein
MLRCLAHRALAVIGVVIVVLAVSGCSVGTADTTPAPASGQTAAPTSPPASISEQITMASQIPLAESTSPEQTSSANSQVSSPTSRPAKPVQEKQPENKENETGVPIPYDEERDALLGNTYEERAAFIASSAKVAQDGALGVPVYRADDLLVDNEACFALGVDHGHRAAMSLRFDTFKRLETIFPSSAIRKLGGGGTIYVVYDIESEGRLFVFFSEDKSRYAFVDGYPILMKEELSYHAFEPLAVGDGIDKVQAIDPAVLRYREHFDSFNDIAIANYMELGMPPTSVHLLTDGILKIEYRRDPVLGYVITNMVYNADFVLDGFDGKTCYEIEAVDYVE